MNYLGLNGLLGLTGDADGPPVQSAGQIADLGGGALMAAFGIMAALRERERSGEGQFVDVSMTDGALSWLAMVAGALPRRRRASRSAARELLTGGFVCYLPYECADGWVTLRRARAEVLAGVLRRVERPDLIEQRSSRRPARTPTPRSPRSSRRGRRAEWAAFNDEHDCCIEPVLDLDEALESELVREREMVVELDQPGARPRAAARASRSSSRARPATRPGRPGARRAHRGGPRERRLLGDEEIAALIEAARRSAGRPQPREGAAFLVMSAAQRRTARELLRMSELAEASDVPAATIKHYLREGLLPEPVKTSRNMAYYPPEFVERIRLIKQLQEERFMPLKVISACSTEDPERAAGAGRARGPDPRARAGRRGASGSAPPRCATATGSRRRRSTGLPSSAS